MIKSIENKIKAAENYVIHGYDQTIFITSDSDADKLLNQAAKLIAWSDCTDEDVYKIVIHGEEVNYCGWEPNMVMTFIGSITNTKYILHKPEWEH